MQTFSGLGLISKHLRPTAARIAEDGLMEVLCVTAIIMILAALYLPAIAKAYKRIITFLGGLD